MSGVCLGMSERRFPPPWTVEKIAGGLKVCDANGQSLAYVYSRENPNDAHMAKVLTACHGHFASMLVGGGGVNPGVD